MLVCPKCQSKNQDTNKFCQRCGTSLTQKPCHECGTEVPVNAETCHNCGALTGTIFWAIIAQEPDELPSPVDSPELPADLTLNEPQITNNEPQTEDEPITQPLSPLNSSNVPDGTKEEENQDHTSEPQSGTIYLDSQQRYQLLEPQKSPEAATSEEQHYILAGRVLDTQPFQESLLDVLVQNEQAESDWDELIPAMAQPYFLGEEYWPTLPKIHDAWKQDGEAVVLLEDRSQRQMIVDLWKHEDIEMAQILYWLIQMTQLWEVLEPFHCRQSLLEITNLRVDEDGVLTLQCLYPEPKDQQLTLEDLGQMWQQLFSQSQRTQLTALKEVFQQLSSNEIRNVDELRSRLQEIAEPQPSPEIETTPNDLSPQEDLAIEPIRFELPEEPPTVIPPKAFGNDDHPSNENDYDSLQTEILPMELSSLIDAGDTDIGNQREHNEDSFGIQTTVKKLENPQGRTVEARGLYILCDGMGGHSAGEVASAIAVETLKDYFQQNWYDQFPTEETMREAVLQANEAIYDENQKNASSGSGRMGTTLVVILVANTKVAIAHVGDSRLYQVTRKEGLKQVTVDHEVGQREIQRGVEPAIAYSRPDAYQLTQALGPRNEEFVNPDVQFLEVNEDTLFLLCSDGLSDNDLVEKYWQTYLTPLISSRANLERGVQELIDLANAHNGHDNITAVLVRLKVRPDMRRQRLF
ncbi:MAG: serine/threonine phosphatase [Symploca sp. SIO2E6]|nr:serine/threonine phosphatase [Symploca sp. SIO2E6]